jgi:Mg/Co/Ni transporter MgtE
VRDVVLRLRQIRRRRVNQIYLVDDENRLLAIIPLQNVILAAAKDRLGELPRTRLVAVPVTATREGSRRANRRLDGHCAAGRRLRRPTRRGDTAGRARHDR